MWSRKMIRRKRARYVANKKKSKCIKQSNPIIKAELSEESVENCNPNASIHETSLIRCVTPVKDSENSCKKFINSGEHKHSELSPMSDKKLVRRNPMLPELVKAVLDRDENMSGFQEGIENDMYECRQYLANLKPQRHVPVPGVIKRERVIRNRKSWYRNMESRLQNNGHKKEIWKGGRVHFLCLKRIGCSGT